MESEHKFNSVEADVQRPPILETSRLILRGHKAQDFVEAHHMWSDPRVVQFIGGRPSTQTQSWTRILSYIGHWQVLNFGYWAVEERSSGQFIGDIGFADFKREITPSLDGLPELGWAITPSKQGLGYATEALSAALDWAKRDRRWTKTACLISPENTPSIRVARKLGFTEDCEVTYNGAPTVLFYCEL